MNLKLELQPKEVFSRIGFSLAISFLVVNGIQLAIIAILKPWTLLGYNHNGSLGY